MHEGAIDRWTGTDLTTTFFSYVLSRRGEEGGGEDAHLEAIALVTPTLLLLLPPSSPSPDFNQVLNTSIVAPGRGSSRLLFFLPLSNRIEPRHGYCTNALGLARLCSPPIG